MRQDLVHFVNQQQVLRQRTGALGTLAQVDSLGFRRSPGVEVEDSRVEGDGRRAYLRVKHRRTGQRCSVDYSPFISDALNRVQCWAGEDDPGATERIGANDVPPTAAVDTFSVAPTTPVTCAVAGTCVCGAVVAPGITAPADQSYLPGSAGTGAFTITNSGGEARAYSLTFSSSNPAVVPALNGPTSVTVPAGGSRTVASTFQVNADAEAGQVAVLPLEATDAACPAVAANAFFSVTSNLVLAAPALTAPANVVMRPGRSFSATWYTTNRTNATRTMVLRTQAGPGLVAADADSVNQTYSRGESRPVTRAYTLDSSVDGFRVTQACLTIRDAEKPTYRNGPGCFTVTAEFLPGVPVVEGGPTDRRQDPGTQSTAVWRVRATSNAGRFYRITARPENDVQIVDSANVGPAIRIGRDSTIEVRVTYRVLARSVAETRSPITLQVEDHEAPYAALTRMTPAMFTVTTALVLQNPDAAWSRATVTAAPAASFTNGFALVNRTNARRTLCPTIATADASLLASSAPGAACVELDAFETRAIDPGAGFTVGARKPAGATTRGTLTAHDRDAGSYVSVRSEFTFTTAAIHRAPTVVRATTPGLAFAPERAHEAVFTVTNESNVESALSLVSSSSAPGVVPDPADPAAPPFAPYETRSVTLPFYMNMVRAGSLADLSLRAANGTGSAAASTRVVTAVSRRAPVLTSGPGVSGTHGETFTIDFQVENRGNTDQEFSLDATSSEAAITAPFGALPRRVVPAFGSATVRLPVTIAAGASANLVSTLTLRATDVTDGSLSAVGSSTARRINTPPTLSLSCAAASVLSTTDLPCTITASDPDGTIASYSYARYTNTVGWERTSGAAASFTVQFARPGAARVAAYVTDNNGAHANNGAGAEIPITVLNRAPAVAATFTPDGQETFNATSLSAIASDLDGVVQRYRWFAIDPANNRIELGTDGTANFTARVPGMWRGYVI
ncbi:MAG TPA: hypothetical protein VGB66_02280, partial [Longimicrobium sp.]